MNSIQLISQSLTCLFETNSPKLKLDNVTNEYDGRGYTCGWAGFTTADEEVVLCVLAYAELVGHSHLTGKIYAELVRLHSEGSDDVSGLDALDFKMCWANAMNTDEGKAAYATIVDRVFGIPAQKHCEELGLKSPVAYAVMFDSVIQHGNDSDPDGVPMMIEWVKRGRFYPPTSYASAAVADRAELPFLREFLRIRKETLENPYNRDTAEEWGKSTGRVAALGHLVDTNPRLEGVIQVRCKDWNLDLELVNGEVISR